MTQKGALDYIRTAGFYSSDKYQWAKPIIDAVLSDTFDDSFLNGFVNSFSEGLASQLGSESENKVSTESKPTASDDFLSVQSILSINELRNIGLVDISEPLHLKEGINVIYGKNASGKSSIYLALCNTLGITKPLLPNLNKNDAKLYAKITVLDENRVTQSLELSNKPSNPVRGVRILDTEICTYLVERDQVNQFELAHLKSEYFPLLNNAFHIVSSALEKCISYLQDNYNIAKEAMVKVFPLFLEYEPKFRKEDVEKFHFADEKNRELIELETEIRLLGKQDIDAVLKNMATAESACRHILTAIGEWQTEKKADGTVATKWAFTLTNKLKNAESILDQHRSLKALVNTAGQNRLGDILPAEWLQKSNWQQFIDASLSFVKSLSTEEKEWYSSSVCPYCLQELASIKAKQLLAAYHALEDENKKLLQQCETKLASISEEIEDLLVIMEQMPKDFETITAELPSIGKESTITIDYARLKEHLSICIKSIKEKTVIPSDGGSYVAIEKAGQEIADLCKRFSEHSVKLNKSKIDCANKIQELEKKASPIKHLKTLTENKELILTCIEAKTKIDSIRAKLTDITSLKQSVSTLATRFSKEIPLGIFSDYMKREYNALRYIPPEIFKLTSTTSGQDNKRVYTLRDKRISEIFSEGERKIHALADFLAEAELNGFRGVYIFDDPVNSLDEERMECVKDRFMRLVEDGNQVIVFTHNLVFLNFLIDSEKEEVIHVTRLTNQVLLEPSMKLGTEYELSKKMKTIKGRMSALSKNPTLQNDEYFLRNVYDIISGYLESYVEIKLFKNVINRYRPNIRMHSLDRIANFNAEAIKPIMALYNQTSRKGSRHSQPAGAPSPTYDELTKHYDQLLKEFP